MLRQKCSTYIQYACAFFLACRQHLIFLRSENPIGYKKTDRVFYAIRFALFRYFLMKGRLTFCGVSYARELVISSVSSFYNGNEEILEKSKGVLKTGI